MRWADMADDNSLCRDSPDPRLGARALRQFPGRILARARSRARLSDRVRRGADRGRLSRCADPGAIRRQRADAARGRRHHGGDPCLAAATARPATRRCTPWARCCGTAATRRRQRWLPAIATRRIAAAGLRRHRADLRHRHAQPAHHRGARRRSLHHQRPEGLDLARGAFRSDAAARAHDAARAGEDAHRRAFGVPGRHAARARRRHQDQSDPHHDEPRHDRDVLRRPARAGGEPDRRGRAGLPLHPLRHERRAHSHRGRMHRRRQMVHRQGHAPMPRSARCSAARSGRTRACSSRSRAPMRRCARPS